MKKIIMKTTKVYAGLLGLLVLSTTIKNSANIRLNNQTLSDIKRQVTGADDTYACTFKIVANKSFCESITQYDIKQDDLIDCYTQYLPIMFDISFPYMSNETKTLPGYLRPNNYSDNSIQADQETSESCSLIKKFSIFQFYLFYYL